MPEYYKAKTNLFVALAPVVNIENSQRAFIQ